MVDIHVQAMTFFSETKHTFPAVKEGEGIPTQQFLLAASEIVPFFGECFKEIFFFLNILSLGLAKMSLGQQLSNL